MHCWYIITEKWIDYIDFQLYLFMVNIHNGAPGLLARGHAQVGLSNVPVHVGEEEAVADGDHIHNQGNATHKVAQVNTFFCKLFGIWQVQTDTSSREIVPVGRELFMSSWGCLAQKFVFTW